MRPVSRQGIHSSIYGDCSGSSLFSYFEGKQVLFFMDEKAVVRIGKE